MLSRASKSITLYYSISKLHHTGYAFYLSLNKCSISCIKVSYDFTNHSLDYVQSTNPLDEVLCITIHMSYTVFSPLLHL